MNDLQDKQEEGSNFSLESKMLPSFYGVMGYPLPLFLLYPIGGPTGRSYNLDEKNLKFSWSKKNPLMDEFIVEIKKYQKLYRNLPFVEMIFLSNSITFNTLNKNSDIDLLIITKKNRIRLARFFASLIFFFAGVKRSKRQIYKKFCLSFFIGEENMDLSQFTNTGKVDEFLAYWTAHLVPIYKGYHCILNNFYQKNLWLSEYFSIPKVEQFFFIGTEIYEGNGWFKRFWEFVLLGGIGNFGERVVAFFWSKRITRVVQKMPSKYSGTVVSSAILKFHERTWGEVYAQKKADS